MEPSPRSSTTCVFCGLPIGSDEPVAGRPPMAGHASCADAALADDSHWDAVAAGGGAGGSVLGEGREEDPATPGPKAATRSGCLGAMVAALGLIAGAGVVTLLYRS